MMLKGSLTALVTPMKSDSDVDYDGFASFIDWQISEGTDGVIPMGTTGESATLSHDEHEIAIKQCVDVAAGRVPVVAGTGSNNTIEAISLTQAAQKICADAALVVTPYYNKPGQRGLFEHYRAIHEATDIPIVIYNIPGRSVVDMSIETMARLAELPRIVGVKDATADLIRPIETRIQCGADFIQLSGEDGSILPFMGAGGHGCISVTSNVAPALCAAFHDAWATGDIDLATSINDKLMPLHTALFTESNPCPAKYALSLLGKMADTVRLPMVTVADETKALVEDAMRHAGLINSL